jgi:mitochondrial fission protein ELM1
MVSEAAATRAPILLADLPGRSKRIRLFLDGLIQEDRARPFEGRLDIWPVHPIDDTPAAGAEVARRLGLPGPIG